MTDDGQPAGGALSRLWTKVSGPGTVTFANALANTTNAAFSAAGDYVLRLTASDGTLSSSDEITISRRPPTAARSIVSLTLINSTPTSRSPATTRSPTAR